MLKEFGLSKAPILVQAERKGISVRYVPLEEDLSGMIFMSGNAPTIVVNSIHHPNRQRFTLGHEIGHFELHMADIGAEVHVDKKFLARDAKAKRR